MRKALVLSVILPKIVIVYYHKKIELGRLLKGARCEICTSKGRNMDTNVIARSVTAAAQKKPEVDVSIKQKSTVRTPLDSFKLIARIANSRRLSDGEKGALINNVSTIDKYASGSLRNQLLDNVSGLTIFMERFAAAKYDAQPIKKAVAEYAAVRRAPAKSAQGSADNLRAASEQLAKELTGKSIETVRKEVPHQEVKAVFNANVNADLKQFRTELETPVPRVFEEVADVVETVTPLPLPGSGSAEEVAEFIPQLQQQEAVAFEAVPLPGSGEVELPDLVLPGSSDVVQEEVALEEVELPAIELPGGGEYEEPAVEPVKVDEIV